MSNSPDENVAIQTPRDRYLVLGFLAIVYLLAAIGFLFLANLTQWTIQTPRVTYIEIFYLRQKLMFLSIAAFLISLSYWKFEDEAGLDELLTAPEHFDMVKHDCIRQIKTTLCR